MRRSGLLRAAVWFATVLLGVPVHAGVFTLVSQGRFVDVTTAGTPVSQQGDKSASAPDFGPFDQTVSLSYPPGVGQSASQQSTLTVAPDGSAAVIDAHGLLSHSASLNGLAATSHFQVEFSLTQAEPYTLTYNGEQGDLRYSNLDTFVAGSFTGPSAPGALAGDPHTTNFNSILTYSGTLAPGTYDIYAQSQTIGFGSFDLHLTVGKAVPLPPAVWQVLAVLPLIVLGIWCVRARAS